MAQNRTIEAKKALIEALEKSLGIVTTACRQVDIARNTFYTYLKDDEEFAKKVKDIENIALDYAETALFKNIKDGKEPSTIFYLKTKGKQRGYIERSEITGKDGEQLFNNMTEQDKQDIVNKIQDAAK